jgi:hypothetical protein
MVLGKLNIHMQNNEAKHYFSPVTQINSKWIEALNVRPETMKLLKENLVKGY